MEEGFHGPRGAGEPAGQARDGFPAGRARSAGARRPGLDLCGRLLVHPAASRGPALPVPAGSSSSRGPWPLTCPVAAAPPLLLHIAARTPAPPAAREDAGLEASSPSPPPPRIPGAAASRGAEAQARRRRGRRLPPPGRTLRLGAPPAPAPSTTRGPPVAPGPDRCRRSNLRPPRRARSQARRFAARVVAAPRGCYELTHRGRGGADWVERRAKVGAPTDTARPVGALALRGWRPWTARRGQASRRSWRDLGASQASGQHAAHLSPFLELPSPPS